MLLKPNRFSAILVSDQGAEGRLGPSTVVLDHTSGFEGLLLVDDDLLGVSVMLAAAGNGLVSPKALSLFFMADPCHWLYGMFLNGVCPES